MTANAGDKPPQVGPSKEVQGKKYRRYFGRPPVASGEKQA